MVDFHSHILFGVDDGSENLEMSIKMIEQSISEGVKILAMTPHHNPGLYESAMENRSEYGEKFDFFRRKFEDRIEIVPSVEIMISEGIMADLESGKLFGYNGSRTVLIEFNLLDYPQYAEGLFYKLKKNGYQVILAHPERNKALREDPEALYHLHDLGVYFQLNAGSLIGQFGEKTETFAKKLIERNMFHAIGSDGHKDKNRDMRIRHAYETVKELNPELYENIMENGPKLIKGEEIQPLPYRPWSDLVRVKKKKKIKKSIFGLFRF